MATAAVGHIEVVLSERTDKKRSVRFDTPDENVSPNNVYLSNEVVEALGNPAAIKVTIEPV